MNELLIFGAEITVIGLMVVFSALILVTLMLVVLDRLKPWLERLEKVVLHAHSHDYPEAATAEPVATPAEEMPADAVSPEIVVAISAAVALALGSQVRIKRIRYRAGQPDMTWSVHGRSRALSNRRISI